MSSDWLDEDTREWVVWREPDGVAIYEGEKDTAVRRRLLTRHEALTLAWMLIRAALP
jgi:hypothetical protein